ncbi:MAG: hypothetical protein ACI9XO_000125 [Paraglaciecola sp.]|jgi:hypothetical protein
MQKHAITLILLFFTLITIPQEKSDAQNPYTQRDYTIGLDIQALIRSPIIDPIGTNILFKKRLKNQNLFGPNTTRHLRFQAGVFIQLERTLDNSNLEQKSKFYTFQGGIEW